MYHAYSYSDMGMMECDIMVANHQTHSMIQTPTPLVALVPSCICRSKVLYACEGLKQGHLYFMEPRFSAAFFFLSLSLSLSLQNITVTVPYCGHAALVLDSDDLDKPPQSNASSLMNFPSHFVSFFLTKLFVVVCPHFVVV